MTDFGKHTTGEEVAERLSDRIVGKTIIVTGGTWGGIGSETIRVLLKYGAGLVIFTGRRESALNDTISNIKTELPNADIKGVIMDLTSFDSVRTAAREIIKITDKIDILINNAGAISNDYKTTPDGFEYDFATNHLGPFLFTGLLIDHLLKSDEPRIVNVASIASIFAPILFDDINFSGKEKFSLFVAYGQSKTANILFTKELSERYKKIKSFSLHPGSIPTNGSKELSHDHLAKSTDYWGNPIFTADQQTRERKTLPEGAATTIVAATNDYFPSGSFLVDCQDGASSLKDYAKSEENARKLWEVSEKYVGIEFGKHL